ncbi:glycosyltransferase family 39 protein [Chloroflexota bacterium]
MAAKTGPVIRSAFWILVALVLFGFALRVCRLDFFPLRGDESFTVLFVTRPLPELVEGIRQVEPNPPFYYFLLRGLIALWGQSDFSARYVSALFGVLTVPLLYQLGRVLLGRDRRLGTTVGLLAALLVAVNPYQIWHSQDVRNYTLWPALGLASLYLMLRALRDNRRLFWASYVVTTLLSLYTHYFHAFVWILENAYFFLAHFRDRSLLRRWFASQATLVLLYFPWLLFGSSRALTYPGDPNLVPGLHEIVSGSLSVFALGEAIAPPLGSFLLPILVLLILLGLGLAFRQDRRAFAFLLLFLVVPTVGLFVLAQWRPLYRPRYLNIIAPAYYLCFALGLAALGRIPRWGKVAMAVGLALLLIPAGLSLSHYYFDPAYAKSSDWRGLAEYLETNAAPDDVIIQNDPDPTLAYYYQGPTRRVVLPHRSAVDQVGDLRVRPVVTGRTLRELLAQHPRAWLIPHQSSWDPEGFVEGWLERRAHKVKEEQVDVYRVVVYEAAETVEPSFQYPVDSHLGDSATLLGYDMLPEGGCGLPAIGGGSGAVVAQGPEPCRLHLTLYWQAEATMTADYTVFVHLVDGDGQVQAQQDSQPQAGGFPTGEWLPEDIIPDEYTLDLPHDIPPGAYILVVGMYDLQTGERLPASRTDGERWPGETIRLDHSVEVMP